ncbi:MAG: NAD(P)H-hydrate dehydratase [Candidatus Altiarchaeota archaeon]|nr:NAD(P)H-hydrate dehydratase [Candidatus Altiarchaeota archaeon]
MDNFNLTKALDMNASYLGVEGILLMENAGKEVALKASSYEKIAVFCGTGNNGGDGLVAARHLSCLGKKVRVYSLKGERTEGNRRNFEIIKKLDSIELEYVTDSTQCVEIRNELTGFGCIIEALIGTGIRGELRQPVKSIADTINASKSYKISVDYPAIEADLVLSFHLPKTEDAKVAYIGIPPEAEQHAGPGDVYLAVPGRSGAEHKGAFGRVLTAGGSRDYLGAPLLAAVSALRSGADLSILAAPSRVLERIKSDPNLIYLELESEHYLSLGDVKKLLEVRHDTLVVGNGLGTKKESADAVKEILRKAENPVVFDADALNLLKERDLGRYSNGRVILTPHRGEFETLFGEMPDSPDVVKEHAEKTGTVILLKSPMDVISDGMRVKLNTTGNAGLTVGGTGDVLAGIVGALACNKKTTLFNAASAAAFICGVAGDLCMGDKGYHYTATDVIEKIPAAFLYCKKFE